MIRETTNPDLDPEFTKLYKGVIGKLKQLIGASKSDVYVLSGEAMLGLEAAIANTVKRGDKVLVISNGVFGEAFTDLVRMYGGEPVVLEADWKRSVDPSAIERALERNPDVKALTLVHCDTPSGILNPVHEIARIAESFGSLSIVDAVSSIGGVPVHVDSSGIDILIGGSQKVLNIPPGLTIVSISQRAWDEIERVGYRGFYLSFKLWKEELDGKGEFPYTMPDHLVRALDESLNMIFEEGLENVYERHKRARAASWSAVEAAGLNPYPAGIEHASPTVTAIEVPHGINGEQLREIAWKKYGVMIAGSWGRLRGRVVRIGHMGIQASRNHLILGFTALMKALRDLGYTASVGKVVEAIEDLSLIHI